MDEPKLPLTVGRSIWNDVASVTSRAFADSYLSGAEVIGNVLLPFTTIAYSRLRANAQVVEKLSAMHLRLVRPQPFGDDEARARLRQSLVAASAPREPIVPHHLREPEDA